MQLRVSTINFYIFLFNNITNMRMTQANNI